jgi:hypothetical protein
MNQNSRQTFHQHSSQVFPVVGCILIEELQFLEAYVGVVVKTEAHWHEFETIPSLAKFGLIGELEVVIDESIMICVSDSRIQSEIEMCRMEGNGV